MSLGNYWQVIGMVGISEEWQADFLKDGVYGLEGSQTTFQVSGKSMESDLIYEDDFVVVDPEKQVNNGDIVVIDVGSGFYLVKHFCKENDHLKFYSSESKNNPMILDDAKIIGKVVAILCKHKDKHKAYEL